MRKLSNKSIRRFTFPQEARDLLRIQVEPMMKSLGSEHVMELNYSLLWDLLWNLRKESVTIKKFCV